ncbi:MAG: HD domain-containing protein, partial [Candidatus Omnitrophica bacterium]|nr:HD domain-containing protein [Candidatus Omnitrophota bacterium]
HDIGKRMISGAHPENSYKIAKKVLDSSIDLSRKDREIILWLIRYHDVFGNIYTGERKVSLLLKIVKDLSLDKQKERLILLQAVTLCDLRGFDGGKNLTEKKARFYLELSEPDVLKQKNSELLVWRIKRFTGSLAGEDNPEKAKETL